MPRIALSSDPAQLVVRPCLPERLRLGIANQSSEAGFTDVYVTAEAPLQSSKTVISTYVPARATVFVNVRVSAPPSAAAGEREIAFAAGRREKLAVPVTVAAPPDRHCLQVTATATSAQRSPDYGPDKAIDGNPGTLWHTMYSPTRDALPQSITLDVGGVRALVELVYQPRADGNRNGIITGYNIYASADGRSFTKVGSGAWAADAARKTAPFDAPDARFIRLEAVEGFGGFASAAEIVLFGRP